MKVKILKKSENELKIEVEGIGHTLCNLLQKKLLEDESVELAGYDIPHPLASNPIIYVRTKGKETAEEALLKAIERLREMNKEFGKELQKALKT
ncbi:MAG: DNA-directed RNA polymerase subunit L [Candidatus Bathyarchaeia archaeon]